MPSLRQIKQSLKVPFSTVTPGHSGMQVEQQVGVDMRLLDGADRNKTKHYILIFVHSFIQRVFVEHLLYAGYGAKCWRGSASSTSQVPALREWEEMSQIILQVNRRV